MKEGTHANKSCDRWLTIVDLSSVNGLAAEEWPQIQALLDDAGVRYETEFTAHRYHAVELTVKAITSGIRRIIVVGGMNALHETVNGLFIQKTVPAEEVTLAIIPVGIPSDCDTAKIPTTYPEAVAAIASGYFLMRPVVSVLYHKAFYGQVRHSVHRITIGMKASLLKKLLRLNEEGRLGRMTKWFAVAKCAVKYRTPKVKIWVDGELAVNARVADMEIITEYSAEVDPGKALKISVTRKSRKIKTIFHPLRRGIGYGASPDAFTLKGSRIKVESHPEAVIAADGDILGYSPAEFWIAPQAVRMAAYESLGGMPAKEPCDSDSRPISIRRDTSLHPSVGI